jgi:hypothetical protein
VSVERTVLQELFAALAAEGVDYVLVGGVAVNLHGIVRATEDADLFVRPDVENVARLRRALHRVTGDREVEDIRAEDLAGAYPVVRYVSPDGRLTVDILARLGERFAYDDLEAEVLQLGDVDVKVATPATLWRMKRDTVRAVDAEDAARLQAAFRLGEEP